MMLDLCRGNTVERRSMLSLSLTLYAYVTGQAPALGCDLLVPVVIPSR